MCGIVCSGGLILPDHVATYCSHSCCVQRASSTFLTTRWVPIWISGISSLQSSSFFLTTRWVPIWIPCISSLQSSWKHCSQASPKAVSYYCILKSQYSPDHVSTYLSEFLYFGMQSHSHSDTAPIGARASGFQIIDARATCRDVVLTLFYL